MVKIETMDKSSSPLHQIPPFEFDRQSHAMIIQAGLRAVSSLICNGTDGVGALASDLSALIGIIADAVEPLCLDEEK